MLFFLVDRTKMHLRAREFSAASVRKSRKSYGRCLFHLFFLYCGIVSFSYCGLGIE